MSEIERRLFLTTLGVCCFPHVTKADALSRTSWNAEAFVIHIPEFKGCEVGGTADV